MDVRRSLLFSLVEKYASFVCSLISVVVLSRLLTPEQTGLYTIASGLVAIAQSVREFGIGTYLVQEKELTAERYGTAFGLALCLGGGLCATFWLSAGWIAAFFTSQDLDELIRLLSVNFLLVPFGSLGMALLRRKLAFSAIMRAGVAGAMAHAAVSVTLAGLGFGPFALAWASIAAVVASLCTVQLYVRAEALVRPNFREWRRVLSVGAFASATVVLGEISQKLPEIVIGRMLGFGAAGHYSRANSLITLFNQTFMHAVWPVATSGFAALNRDGKDLGKPYSHALVCLTGLAWPVLAVLSMLAPTVITLAFGEQWLPAAPAARILCAAAAFAILGQVSMVLLNATGRVRSAFAVQGTVVPLQVVLIVLAASRGIEAVAVVAVVVAAIHAGLILRDVHRQIGCRLRATAAAAACSLAVTAVAVVPSALVGSIAGFSRPLGWTAFGLVALATTLIWLAAVFALRHPLRGEITALWGALQRRLRARVET